MAGQSTTTVRELESRGRKGAKKMAHATGRALKKGVEVSEKVAKSSRPAAKALLEEGKKSVKKLKETTLKAAEEMEKW